MLPQGNKAVRASRRRSRPAHRPTSGLLYIEGHGEWRAGLLGHRAMFRVPDSMEIVLYQGIGAGLDDQHGQDIARGLGVPARLPTLWDAHSGEYDTELPATGGKVRQNTSGRAIYYGGDMCPDLTLFACDEPGFPAIVAQQGSFTVQAGHPVTLQAIAELYDQGDELMPVQLHWCACTVLR